MTSAVAEADAVVVVVPLFVDNDGVPDVGWMDAATEKIAAGLKPGTLVSYETTLPVGTTRNRFAPAIEKISGLKAGTDFDLVFSPERVLTGRVFADLRKYPKLVGGINEKSTKAGIDFYQAVLDFDDRPDLTQPNGVWDLLTCEASEMAKLAETDAVAKSLFDDFGHQLGLFLLPWMVKFGVEVLVIGGNISYAFPLFGESLNNYLISQDADIRIAVSELKETASMIGSSVLVDESYFEKVKLLLPQMS